MAILSKGTDFSTGDQVTAAKLDALVDNATFASGAVDNSTTALDTNGKIIVKDGGITTAKLNLTGNVGIGDTSPSHELVVKNVTDASTDCFIQVVSGDSSNAGILFGDNSDNSRASIFVENDTDKLFLSSPNTDKALVIDSLEQVGIGTSSPEATLHVNDRYSTGPCILVENSSSTEGDIAVRSGEALQMGHWDNTASEPNKFIERLSINSSGNLVIANIPTSASGLSSGTVYSDSGTLKIVS